VQQQLRPLFGQQADYDKFVNSVMAERQMFQTKTPVMGGSQTATRIAEDANNANEGGPMMKLIAGGLAAKGGEPFLGASVLLRGGKDIYGRMSQPTAAAKNAMAGMMFNPNNAANQRLLQQIQQLQQLRPPTMGAPPGLLVPGAQGFGLAAPSLIRNNSPTP
jgi:hypothetical protein